MFSLATGRKITAYSAVLLALGGVLFGYDSGIITPIIALDSFVAYFDQPSGTVTGGIVSAL